MKELMEIRQKLMEAVEAQDWLFVKMQINNLDTIIYQLSQLPTANLSEDIALELLLHHNLLWNLRKT